MSHQPSLYSCLLIGDNQTTVDTGTEEEPSIYVLLNLIEICNNLVISQLTFQPLGYLYILWDCFLHHFNYMVFKNRDHCYYICHYAHTNYAKKNAPPPLNFLLLFPQVKNNGGKEKRKNPTRQSYLEIMKNHVMELEPDRTTSVLRLFCV